MSASKFLAASMSLLVSFMLPPPVLAQHQAGSGPISRPHVEHTGEGSSPNAPMPTGGGRPASPLVPFTQKEMLEEQWSYGKSNNVIYFIHGYECDRLDNYKNANKDPHYFVYELALSRKWDVINVNFLPDACKGGLLAKRAAAALIARVAALKAAGYRRVVIGGQSLGAWSALWAAQDPSLKADALLLMAPANWGKATRPDGQKNTDFEKNLTEYTSLISNVRIPVVAAFFTSDNFDPGGRGQATEEVLGENSIPHLVIDRAANLSGHGAAWLPLFDYKFGDCINRFLLKPEAISCPEREASSSDFRSIESMSQIKDIDAKRMTDEQFRSIVGVQFVTYLNGGGVSENIFKSGSEVDTSSVSGDAIRPASVSNGRYCYSNGNTVPLCRIMIRWSEDKMLAFDESTGHVTSWWVRKGRP